MSTLVNEGLKREIGSKSIAANAINAAIGAGIFVLPARVSETLGSAAILAYLICGALIFIIMLCFAELGSRVSESGGAYVYVGKAFGPFFGFLVSNVYWFGFGLISDAAIINALVEMLATQFPLLSNVWAKAIFFLVSFSIFGYINVVGVKQGSMFVEFLTFVKMLPLMLLILVGWSTVQVSNLELTWTTDLTSIGSASFLLFFAFGGAESALSVGGEIKNPKRAVPLGILWGIGIVVVIYILIHLVVQGILGNNIIAYKEAPLAMASAEVFGPVGPVLIFICTAVCIWGTISGDVLTMPRFMFANSKDKLLPQFLSHIHPKFATPYKAIIVYVVLAFALSLSGGFKQLAILSSAAILLTYFSVVMAAIKLRIDKVIVPGNGFTVRGGYVIHFVALSAIIWLLTNLTMNEMMAIGLALLFFCAIYGVKNYRAIFQTLGVVRSSGDKS